MTTQKELRKELSKMRKEAGCKSGKGELNTKAGVERAIRKMKGEEPAKKKISLKRKESKSESKPKTKIGLKYKSEYNKFVAKTMTKGRTMREVADMWNAKKK